MIGRIGRITVFIQPMKIEYEVEYIGYSYWRFPSRHIMSQFLSNPQLGGPLNLEAGLFHGLGHSQAISGLKPFRIGWQTPSSIYICITLIIYWMGSWGRFPSVSVCATFVLKSHFVVCFFFDCGGGYECERELCLCSLVLWFSKRARALFEVYKTIDIL